MCAANSAIFFHSAFRRHAGVALLTVLLIVFLASVTAVSLAALQQAIRRSTVRCTSTGPTLHAWC
ncbi:MAG: hypothetical protein U1F42_02415 [Candidatus Competibacteraceae bacterium]